MRVGALAGLEEATAGDGGCPRACQGLAKPTAQPSGREGELERGCRGQGWRGTGGREAWQGRGLRWGQVGKAQSGEEKGASIHLVEGDDGAGWGGLSAREGGFQWGRPRG